MNKFKYYFFAALLCGFSFSFVSCDKDDDDPKDDNQQGVVDELPMEAGDIVGTWMTNNELSSFDMTMDPTLSGLMSSYMDSKTMAQSFDIFGDSIIFKNDNTFSSAKVSAGTYEVDGNQLSMTFVDGGETMDVATGKVFASTTEITGSAMDGQFKIDQLSYGIIDSQLVVFLNITVQADLSTMDLSEIGVSSSELILLLESMGIKAQQEFSMNYKFYFDKK